MTGLNLGPVVFPSELSFRCVWAKYAAHWNYVSNVHRAGFELARAEGHIGPKSLLGREHSRTVLGRTFLQGIRRIAYLTNLASTEREQGHGSRLIEAFCEHAQAKRATACFLDVSDENTDYLIGFYQRRGFVLLAPKTKAWQAVMARRLGA